MSRSRTKRRRSLTLISSSKTASAAAFTSATKPCWSRAIAGTRIALSAAAGEAPDPRARRSGGDLDQAPREGSKNALLLGAQIAGLRIHVEKIHINP